MKKELRYQNIVLLALLLITALSSTAQQQFIITAARANNYCNGTCTILDNPDLNGNPTAIIFVTPIEINGINLNPHPICAYYISNKWSVKNIDDAAIQPGAQFNVTYFRKADSIHFVHVVNSDNLVVNNNNVKKRGSYIDHAGLNDNPNARFGVFQNQAPSLRGGNVNRYDIQMKYDSLAGRWYITNTNDRALENSTAYNIIISNPGNIVAVPVKEVADILVKHPDIIKDIIPKKIIPRPYDFSHVHICMDDVTNNILPPKPSVTPLPKIPKIKPNGELETVSTITQPLSVATEVMWWAGASITVGFPPGVSSLIREKVKKYAKEWETFANIRFVFINDGSQAMVKVGFKQDGTSWSWMGRKVLVNPNNAKTMNLGWLDELTDEAEFKRVVTHEFGHVLGFIHEHQSPNAGMHWDSAKVYSYFMGDPNNWSKEKIDYNIFEKYSKLSTNSSAYDTLSIMHYFFPAGLTTDSISFPQNYGLSELDKSFAGQVYPYPPGPATATGVLSTGDDCDEIEFKVEYNVVNNNEIAFILEPGKDPSHNNITWWKKIAIPVIGNGEVGIEIQNGYSATKRVAAVMIDKGRGIGFGKAKILGVHTGLGYTWNAWPAIISGCRVTLTWRRDRC